MLHSDPRDASEWKLVCPSGDLRRPRTDPPHGVRTYQLLSAANIGAGIRATLRLIELRAAPTRPPLIDVMRVCVQRRAMEEGTIDAPKGAHVRGGQAAAEDKTRTAAAGTDGGVGTWRSSPTVGERSIGFADTPGQPDQETSSAR